MRTHRRNISTVGVREDNHALAHILSELTKKTEENEKQQVAKTLQQYVLTLSREMSSENFKKWYNSLLKESILPLISGQANDKISAVLAIDELIEISSDDGITILSQYLNLILKTSGEFPQVLMLASKALGHLAKGNSTIVTECIEFELKTALEWLQGDRNRYAASMALKELALSSPVLFYSHVPTFVDVIWVTLRDPKPSIRESAVEALGACLQLISERESRFRGFSYQKIYDEAQKGFVKHSSIEMVHASLITIGELLKNTGDFFKDRFTDICKTVLRYKENRDKVIRKTVITLYPKLAQFSPEKFISSCLEEVVTHLLYLLKKDIERGTCFISLGEITLHVGKAFNQNNNLDNTIAMIKLGLAPKTKQGFSVVPEAIVCVSMLAKAFGPELQKYMPDLLDLLFAVGLHSSVTASLADLAEYVPSYAQEIQERLLDLLSVILAHKNFVYPGTPSKLRKKANIPTTQPINADERDRTVALALNTLGSFKFSYFVLIDFLRECVVNFLSDRNLIVRKEAAICCGKLMTIGTNEQISKGFFAMVVSEVIEKLLAVGIADSDNSIRLAVLNSLDTRFDKHLAQASNLRLLFIALNDEIFLIRELSLTIICRLAYLNPAYVMPSLRTTLIHLLVELDYSGDNRTKEESSRLLGHIIRSVSTLVQPYADRVMKALLPKLRDYDSQVSSSCLSTVGELSLVAGWDIIPHLDDLLPLIIETLQDQSSSSKREVALRTLGHIVESTGYVIEPFVKYPRLLDAILNLIQSEVNPSIRKEVIKVFGIIGALDPYRQKMNQLLLEGRQDDEEGTGRTQKAAENKESEALRNLSPSSEDYFPTITIQALMRILSDPTLSMHHITVVHALMLIIKNLGMKSIQFLPQIMPPFLSVLRTTTEPEFRTILFQQLGRLVNRVKQHIRDYLEDIFKLIKEYWDTRYLLVYILTLVEELSLALSDEFRKYLPELLPQMLAVLHDDTEPKRTPTSKILHGFEVFGTNLDDYLNLVIPAVVKLCEPQPQSQPSENSKIQIEAVQTLHVFCHNFNVVSYASRILQTLSRVLDSSTDKELRMEIMKAIRALVKQLGTEYKIFIPIMQKPISKWNIQDEKYESLVTKILADENIEMVEGGDDAENLRSSRSIPEEEDTPLDFSHRKIKSNEKNLKKVWEVSQRSTKEDWTEWLRKFSVELLKESPSPALRSCISLGNDYPPIVKELFNAAFVSCWSELHEQYQDDLVRSLETALLSKTIPPEILQTILNLAEFMEQDEKPLPIDPRTLGSLAEKCNAYAKALHYKETEFRNSPTTTIEALISINNQLQQPEAALGILNYAQKYHNIELKESWYEKLQRWQDALEAYKKKKLDDFTDNLAAMEITLGKMRCYFQLGEWEELSKLSSEVWDRVDTTLKQKISPLAAAASWNLFQWEEMSKYVQVMDKNSTEGSFFRAILSIHKDQYDEALGLIEFTRQLEDRDLPALVGESYNRAYKVIVHLQHLAELEEVIEYKKRAERRKSILQMWNKRLLGCERSVDTWQNVLAVRSLVLTPHEDLSSWLKFSALCRKNGRFDLSEKTLITLLGMDPSVNLNAPLPLNHPRASFAYIKHSWAKGVHKNAFQQLRKFAPSIKDDPALQARVYLKLGEWQSALQPWDETTISQVTASFHASIKNDTNWYKAWHKWALANYNAVTFYEKNQDKEQFAREAKRNITTRVVYAISGFFRSIALAPTQSLQDTLRLLTLWFKHGGQKEVELALMEGFSTVSIDNWLQVIPQIIARIHAPVAPVRRLIHELLTTIGKAHPQALAYPLTVSGKSGLKARAEAAVSLTEKMKKHSPELIEQAQLVSEELIRVSILWHEMWHEGLEEASRTYFADHNTQAMLATLKPLHELLEKGPETAREISFTRLYGRDLQEAFEWCKKWERSHKTADLDQAWDLYYRVFRRISKQLPQLVTLELQHVSPKLLTSVDLKLAVPGTYKAGQADIRIKGFAPTLNVITSKQRPRKLVIYGSDGADYMFLLKGHEDLRQDERVMQLFGLVNQLLAAEYETSKNHLNIQRYSVIPLSPNSGLIGWVPHCDTMHQLIRDYRDSRKILINIEHRLMLQMAPDYDNLCVIQKVEVFQFALDQVGGQDLEKILWLKSNNSEAWLDRRTNYTRSLGVMSMVGYILGLGDRHPGNLMLDRHTGKVLHIDFGDCFEVAMQREKYPEKIPFRLTRMLINAMEVSGIEGTYRITCENVMRVLRENKDSLMAVLEAFVYDPIINWRLITSPDMNKSLNIRKDFMMGNSNNTNENLVELSSSLSNSYNRAKDFPSAESMPEILNKRALQVIRRVSNKLTGRDFDKRESLDIKEQVQRLIDQATSHENLCQCYIGWCPFW